MTETATDKRRVRLTITEAAELTGESYSKLRELAVDKGEFTTIRDGVGRGFRINLRRDEVQVYEEQGLEGLRAFRRKQGRK